MVSGREDKPATGCCELWEEEAAGTGCCGRRERIADEVAATGASCSGGGNSGCSLGNRPKSSVKGRLREPGGNATVNIMSITIVASDGKLLTELLGGGGNLNTKTIVGKMS